MNVALTPFIYFKNYKSYNKLNMIGVFATGFVMLMVIVCCVIIDNEDRSSETINLYDVC